MAPKGGKSLTEESLKAGFNQNDFPERGCQWAWGKGPLPGSGPTGIKTALLGELACLPSALGGTRSPRCSLTPGHQTDEKEHTIAITRETSK